MLTLPKVLLRLKDTVISSMQVRCDMKQLMSKEDLEDLDQEIDSYIDDVAILKWGREQALIDVIRYYDYLVYCEYMPRYTPPSLESAITNLLDSFTTILQWVHERCVPTGNYNFLDASLERFDDIKTSVVDALEYKVVFDLMADLRRGRTLAKRRNNNVRVEYSRREYSKLDAATHLLSGPDMMRQSKEYTPVSDQYAILDQEVHPNVLGPLIGYKMTTRAVEAAMNIADHGTQHLYELDENWDFEGYTLKQFRRVWNAILAMVHIHLHAILKSNDGDHKIYSIDMLKSRKDWIDCLHGISGEHRDVIDGIIDDLVYDISMYRKGKPRIDVRYQPFITIGDDKIMLSNSAAMYSNIERNLWHLLSIKRKATHSVLSTEKEGLWRTELTEWLKSLGYNAIGDIEYEYNGKKSNIDLVIVDEERKYVLTVEMKWHYGPDTVREVADVDREIEKGIRQAGMAKLWLSSCKDDVWNNLGIRIRDEDKYLVQGIVLSKNSLGSGKHLGGDIAVGNENLMKWILGAPHHRTLAELWYVLKNLTYFPRKGKHYKDKADRVRFGKITFTSVDLCLEQMQEWKPESDIVFRPSMPEKVCDEGAVEVSQ